MQTTDDNTRTLTADVGDCASGYALDSREELALVTAEEEIQAVLGSFSDPELGRVAVRRGDVTALLLDAQEGEYVEVWAAETRYPGSLKASYTRIR